MLAGNYIYKEMGVLRLNDYISTAVTLMDELKVNHLPVVENNTFFGLISEDFILELSSLSTRISEYQIFLKKIFIFGNQHIYDAAKIAAIEHIDIIPVLSNDENYLGCITQAKLLQAFSILTSATEEGSVLVLSMNINDLFISEIARLIESNDAKIINLYVTPVPQSTQIKVTIKINKPDLSRIIQTLNRYNYSIDTVYGQTPTNDNLSDKYKLLMKYLSI